MNRRHAHREDPWRYVTVREFLGELVVFALLCAAIVALVFIAGDYR